MSQAMRLEMDLPFLSRETNRHGKTVFYARRFAKRIRIKAAPGSPEFAKAYAEALERLELYRAYVSPRKISEPAGGSLAWLGAKYFASQEFAALAPVSRRTRRLILESCFSEPRKPGAPEKYGECPLRYFGAKQVLAIRDRVSDRPGAANNRLKYLSAMFGWAIENRLTAENPVRYVRQLGYESDGFHTWTVDEFRQFEDFWPVGSKPRLALALLAYTGARRSDLVTLGRQHIRNGVLSFVPAKTRMVRGRRRKGSPIAVTIPIIPELAEAIEAGPCGDLTFLLTEYGRPFTAAGFGGWFRDKCDKAGLPKCTAHGLRKAAAVVAAEHGATTEELNALFGWTTNTQSTDYTAKANRVRLAETAVLKMRGTK